MPTSIEPVSSSWFASQAPSMVYALSAWLRVMRCSGSQAGPLASGGRRVTAIWMETSGFIDSEIQSLPSTTWAPVSSMLRIATMRAARSGPNSLASALRSSLM